MKRPESGQLYGRLEKRVVMRVTPKHVYWQRPAGNRMTKTTILGWAKWAHNQTRPTPSKKAKVLKRLQTHRTVNNSCSAADYFLPDNAPF